MLSLKLRTISKSRKYDFINIFILESYNIQNESNINLIYYHFLFINYILFNFG
jgi:hypothetical protein